MRRAEVPCFGARGAVALALSIVALASWCAAEAAAKQRAPRLSPISLGSVRLGMTPRQAARAAHVRLRVTRGVNGCSFWTDPDLPPYAAQLIAFHNRLGYIELDNGSLSTTRGITNGSTVSALKRAYGKRLRRGRTANLDGASDHRFLDQRVGGVIYSLEFDVEHGKVIGIEAASQRVIQTFGECA